MKRSSLTKQNAKGQGLVEYSLIASLVGVVLIGVLTVLGPEIKVMANDAIASVSGGATVQDGVLIIPSMGGSTLTPIASSIPTDTSIPTNTPTLIPAPTMTASPIPTATELACTPGNANNITSRNACKALRDANNCQNYSYSSSRDTCSWN